ERVLPTVDRSEEGVGVQLRPLEQERRHGRLPHRYAGVRLLGQRMRQDLDAQPRLSTRRVRRLRELLGDLAVRLVLPAPGELVLAGLGEDIQRLHLQRRRGVLRECRLYVRDVPDHHRTQVPLVAEAQQELRRLLTFRLEERRELRVLAAGAIRIAVVLQLPALGIPIRDRQRERVRLLDVVHIGDGLDVIENLDRDRRALVVLRQDVLVRDRDLERREVERLVRVAAAERGYGLD